jgi:hypothetical protein
MSHRRPPTATPPGGLLCVRPSLRRLTSAAVIALIALSPQHADAQLIRGTIRAQGSDAIVQGASITVLDSLDKQLVAVSSDDKGHFVLPLSSPLPFRVTVRKIGWQPSSTDLIHASRNDTLDMDLTVPVEGVTLASVEVDAKKTRSFNEESYAEAKRLGWKVYEPSEIESRRYEFSDFENMMRALQVTGVKMPGTSSTYKQILPNGTTDCYINIRNGRCFTFVVDGQALGTSWVVNPVDVYFIAILQSSESSVQFGDKAPWGAILIVTRMNGDKKSP